MRVLSAGQVLHVPLGRTTAVARTGRGAAGLGPTSRAGGRRTLRKSRGVRFQGPVDGGISIRAVGDREACLPAATPEDHIADQAP